MWTNIFDTIRSFSRKENGQTLSEYALILVLVVIAAIVVLTALGGSVQSVFTTISNALSGGGGS